MPSRMPVRLEPHTRDCPPPCGIGSNLSAMQELMASCASSARRSAAATSHGVIAWWISTATPTLSSMSTSNRSREPPRWCANRPLPPCGGGQCHYCRYHKRTTVASHLKKLVGPLRRASIFGLFSYGGLVLINNSELDLPNMWIAYLPMFIGVYVLTQWLDKQLGD